MDLGIAGKKAIVCASSRGLGKACATRLAEAGCDVVINGRDGALLEQVASELSASTGGRVTFVVADLNIAEDRARLLAACPEPDILVNNNAGPPTKDFRDLDEAALAAGVAANMIVPIALTQAVIDGMIARRFGRIINITSGSVKAPLPGLDLSSGARAGLTAFFAGVARQVAAHNVTINQILPGAFDTDRQHAIAKGQAAKQAKAFEEVWAARANSIPAKRYGDADEFGALCAYIASAQAGYMTGQNFLIDGGAYPGAF